MSILKLHDVRQSVKLGCSEEERAYPQIVSIDLELSVNVEESYVSDELGDTVDYLQVIDCISRLTAECSWKLVEKMCFDIGQEVLALSQRVELVLITVTKDLVAHSSGFSCSLTVGREQS